MIDDKAGSAQTETPARVLQPEGSAKRHTTVRLGVIAAVLAAAMSLAPSAMAAPADDKELCKSGGYANYVDPTTGAPFSNQGQCVSFVNGGGVLVPVQEEPPVPVAPTLKLSTPALDSTTKMYRVSGEFQGQPNTEYQLMRVVYSPGWNNNDPYSGPTLVTTDAEGLARFNADLPAGNTLYVSHAGVILGTVTAATPPAEMYNPTIGIVDPSGLHGPSFFRVGWTLSGWEPGTWVTLRVHNSLGGVNDYHYEINAEGNGVAGGWSDRHEMFGSCADSTMFPTLLEAEGPVRADGTRLTATVTPPIPASCT